MLIITIKSTISAFLFTVFILFLPSGATCQLQPLKPLPKLQSLTPLNNSNIIDSELERLLNLDFFGKEPQRHPEINRVKKEELKNRLNPYDSGFIFSANISELELFMEAMIFVESKGNHYAVSSKGAQGILQFMRSRWNTCLVNYEQKYGQLSYKERIYPGTPASQRKVGLEEIKRLWQKYGKLSDIACDWYTGKSVMQAKQSGIWWQKQGWHLAPKDHVAVIIKQFNKNKIKN